LRQHRSGQEILSINKYTDWSLDGLFVNKLGAKKKARPAG